MIRIGHPRIEISDAVRQAIASLRMEEDPATAEEQPAQMEMAMEMDEETPASGFDHQGAGVAGDRRQMPGTLFRARA